MNETFMHVSCDPSIERELSEHFQFFVPGYKFMPAYRNRMWDGKIRLYDFKKQTLYNGLFKYLKEFADLRDYKVITAASPAYGKIGETQNVDLEPFLAPLVLSGAGKRIIPRNYQQTPIVFLIFN